MVLSFALGPLGVFLPRQVQSGLRKIVALTVVLGGGILLWQWPAVSAGMARAPLPLLVFGSVLHLGSFLGFLIWSGVVRALVEDTRPHLPQLDPRLFRPATILLLGLCVPGLGLALLGRAGRAGAALWSVFLVAGCALIGLHAPALWNRHLALGWDSRSSLILEGFFVLWAVAGVTGILVWIIQALDGVRLASADHRPAPGRGDRTGGFLLAAMVVLLLTTRPLALARDVDYLAQAARNEELVLIPAGLTLWATKLDPAQPVYALHLADLYEDLGRFRHAESIRRTLRDRWTAYEAMTLAPTGITRREPSGTTAPPPLVPFEESGFIGPPVSAARPRENADPTLPLGPATP